MYFNKKKKIGEIEVVVPIIPQQEEKTGLRATMKETEEFFITKQQVYHIFNSLGKVKLNIGGEEEAG